MVGEPGSLTGFIMDELRRSRTSDIADQLQNGQIQPADALVKYAQITGDPTALQQGAQQSALARLNSGNTQVNQILPWLAPNDVVGTLTNPMLMQGAGATPTYNQNSASTPQTNPVGTSNPAPAQSNQPVQAGQPNRLPGLDYNYLNTAVPPFYRNQVLDVIQGGELAKDVSPRDRTLVMNWAHNVDPTFTETKGTMRNKMATDISSNTAQSQGGQAQQLNSVAGHLYDLHEASYGLNNTASPMWNSIANKAVGGTDSWFPGIGGSPIHANQLQGNSRYNEILNRASPELNKFYVGGEGDIKGRELGIDAFRDNLPDDIIRDNVKTQLGMLHSKVTSLQNTRDDIMGSASSPVVKPVTQALIADINGQPLTKQQQDLVNAHRLESNLPPKTWKITAPSGYEAMPLPQPKSSAAASPAPQTAQQPQKPALDKASALAEAKRRGLTK